MDEIALIEREKYLAVWARKEYRAVSPGMMEVERAWTVCEMREGASLIDFGSGPARATLWFQDRGLLVTAVDFAPNARETNVPFVEACLWELPESLAPADYAYCCDVMEHIPPEKIDETLAGIAARTLVTGYFRIATRPDRMGPKLIGKPLHVTVQSGEWWRRTLERFFPRVDVVEMNARDVVLLVRR